MADQVGARGYLRALVTGLAWLSAVAVLPVQAQSLNAPVAAATAPAKKPAPKPATTTAKPAAAKPAVVAPRPKTVAERLFAHRTTDIPIDPKTKVGRFANGMTYVIYPNATPAGAVSMRLRFEVGGINERAGEHGLAHFLEHMAFLGSEHIPEGELIRMLERAGLRFGADTNAFTSVNTTYYQLDLPRSDKASLNTGLFILSETASALKFDPAAFEREREVVLSELRTSDSGIRRAYNTRIKALLAGQAYADHQVIGTAESLKALTVAQLDRFYRTHYRPERATLVVVGDVDPAQLEVMIAEKFAGWKAALPAPPPVVYGNYKPKGLSITSYVEPGLSPYLSLSWFRPYDESLTTRASYREAVLDILLIEIIKRRLGAVNSNFAPYEMVSFGDESYTHGASGLTVSMLPKAGQQSYGITRAYETVRQFATYGDTETYAVDVSDAIARLNLAYKNAAADADTRSTSEMADQWMRDIEKGATMMSPTQELALWNSLKPGLTAKALKARLNDWLSKDGPNVFYMGPKPTELSAANLREHWTLASLMTVPKPAPFVRTEWPYTTFGAASPVVSEEVDSALGFTRLTYASGLKVNVKTTPFKSDEVQIRVRFVGGTNRMSPGSAVPASLLRFYDRGGMLRSGVGELGGVEVDDALVGRNYSLSYRLSEGYTDIDGETSREDVKIEAQLLMAFLTKPSFDDFAIKSVLSQYESYHEAIQNESEELVSNSWWSRLFPGDARYALPEPETVARITPAQFRNALLATLASRPTEVTFVGAISVDEVKAVVNETFATLKVGPAVGVPAPAPSVVPAKTIDLVHKGKEGEAAVIVTWPTEGYYPDLRRARGLRLLSGLMTQRLNTIMREREGLAYSPYAYWTGSTIYNQGFLLTMAGINPAQEQRFFATLNQITDQLKTQPIPEDELLRVRKPLIEARLADEKSNDFWIGMVSDAPFEPQIASAIADYQAHMMSYSPEELQLMARTYLTSDRAIVLIARPGTKTSPTGQTLSTGRPHLH